MSKAKGGASAASSSGAAGAGGADGALLAAVKSAVEKPALSRQAGLSALSSLLLGSWSNAASNPAASKQLLPLLKDAHSFVNMVAAIGDENIDAFLPLHSAVLGSHWAFLTKNGLDAPAGGAPSAFLTTVARLCVHPSTKVRRAVLENVRRVLASGAPHVPALSAALLRSLQQLLYSKKATTFAPENNHFVWSRALLTFGAPFAPDNIPLALWLAHDPLLSNAAPRRESRANGNMRALVTAWTEFQLAANEREREAAAAVPAEGAAAKKPNTHIAYATARAQVLASIEGQMGAISQRVLSDQGLLAPATPLYTPPPAPAASSKPSPAAAAAAAQSVPDNLSGVGDLDAADRAARQRETTVAFLLALFVLLPDACMRALLPSLRDQLSHPDLAKLSDSDLAVYRTPEGQLCEFVPAGEFRAVAAETKKRDKDWTEKDEELERRAREIRAKQEAAAAAKKPSSAASSSAKGGAGKAAPGGKAAPLTGAAKVEADNKRKLEEQSALRAKLTAAKRQVEPLLRFFGLLAVRAPTLMHDRVLTSVVPLVQPLICNEVVRDAAVETHRRFVHCLDTPARQIGFRLSFALETLLLAKDPFADPLQRRLLANTLLALRDAARKHTFSPQTFRFVFPLLRATITHSADADVAEADKDAQSAAAAAGADEAEEKSAPARRVKPLSADGDEDADDEEELDEEEADDEKEEKSSPDAASPSSTAAASSANTPDVADVEKPLGAGLQLGLSCADEVVRLHCEASLHEREWAGGERFPVSDLYSTLLHVLANINALYNSALQALLSLSRSTGVRSDEVLPLLGGEGVLSCFESLRLNALQGVELLACFAPSIPDRTHSVPNFRLLTERLWIACHDPNSDVSSKAAALWEGLKLEIDPSYLDGLIALLASDERVVRDAVGSSIASALQLHPASVGDTLTQLLALFVASPDEEKSANKLGVRQAREFVSRAHTRSGVAHAVGACSDSLGSEPLLRQLLSFVIAHGLRDMDDSVWDAVLGATVRVLNQHGAAHMDLLLPILEQYLNDDAKMREQRAAAEAAASKRGGKAAASASAPALPDWSEEEEAQNDRLREGVILSMGTLARHMDPENPRVVSVVDSLLHSLNTPAHSVQKSVAECLAPLMAFPAVAEHAPRWIELMLTRLRDAEEYGERKGAAFGLAAMIRGLKLAALKKYNVLETLAVMVQDKTSANARQGALFAYERLFHELGARFEPYVVGILPHLLACYGDSNADVRDATSAASRVIMRNLTGHGVKMTMPLILAALDSKAWRTKLESIGLLSAMAYCSPAQLSACLPQIVPRLLEVMTDPHAQVQQASRAALRQIASVIKAPEILSLVPQLLRALNDPTQYTKAALQDLMRTSFVHSVDPPSLAIILPILRSGLKARTAVTKKMSAQVVGSMCSLIGDVKDILPYAPTLLKYLKQSLVDNHPEVRTVTARALAALYKGISEAETEVEGFANLREWLLATLRSDDTTPTVRSGCAQGLAQLLAVQGLDATSQLLPELFAETKNEKAVVREAFFLLFQALPDAFGQLFSIFVADVLPIVVEGLADEIGLVREAALAAGQSLVLNFAQSKTDLLLPALEDGIVNADWRIRLSSVQLLGVMLLRLAGVSVRLIVGAANAADDDDASSASTICTRQQEAHIESVLGTDRRNRLLSTIYLMRCDVVPGVADLSFRVWKSIVSNSPRMLTALLPVLMSLIISDLASAREDRQHAAGRTLGELVNKMGDLILSEIVPILQTRLQSDDTFTRQGVCLGLSEVMSSARKADLAAWMADLIPSVRDALCDSEEVVRRAAGTCFQTLLRTLGRRAIEDIVPSLLRTLDEEEGDEARSALVLEGVKTILSINSNDVLPYLVPALATTPLTLYHARAIAFLAPNINKGFIRFVDNVTAALIDGLSRSIESGSAEQVSEMRVACSQIIQCIVQDCVHSFVNVCEETSQSTRTPSVKQAVAYLIASFTANTRVSFDSHLPLLLQILLRLFVESPELQQAGLDALSTMMKSVPEDRASKHIAFVRSVIGDLSFDSVEGVKRDTVPGFNLKGGIAPLLPMMQDGLMHGSPSVRVDAAEGLSDLVQLTSEAALGPYVIKMTGPLIRIVGDRFPAEVKSAILRTLHLLIGKCARHLKPFLPQLQTTFLKALQDPNALVRARAAAALADLLSDPKRASSVLSELASQVASDIPGPIKTSMLGAMVGIVRNGAVGPALAPEVVSRLSGLAADNVGVDRDSMRRESSKLLAVLSPLMPDAEFVALVQDRLMRNDFATSREVDGSLMAIQACTKISGSKIDLVGRAGVIGFGLRFLQDKQVNVVCAAILCLGELMLHAARSGDVESVQRIASALAPQILHDVAQVRQDAASRFQLLGETSASASAAVLDAVVPSLLSRSQDSNGPARAAVVGALHTLFQFHTVDGLEAGEKAVGAYYTRAAKKDAASATALKLFVQKSVARAKISPVQDELWNNTQQGESLAEASSSSDATDE